MADPSWNVRFGQIFRHRLDELEAHEPGRFRTRFQDCFYFHPEEEAIVRSAEVSKEALKLLDLNLHVDHYRRYFTPAKSPRPHEIDRQLAERLNTTFVIVPGFARELLRATEMLEFSRKALVERGFDLRYVPYPDSWGAKRSCARELAEVFSTWEDVREHIVFIGHSYGILVALDLIEEKAFRPWRPKVRALVSLAGALAGSPDADDPRVLAASQVMQIYRKIKDKQMTLEARLVKGLRDLLDLDIPWAAGVRSVLERVDSFSEDLLEIPEGLESLSHAHSKWSKPEEFPEDCDLFSLSALYPREALRGGDLLPDNPDDLFLYLVSKPLTKEMNPLNDTQFTLQETRFPIQDNLKTIHLGTVRGHHWGVAMPRVLSKTHLDQFPRQALLETLMLFFAEYYAS